MEHHPNYTWSAPPPSMLTNVRIPSDQIIESLGFLFNLDSDNNYNYYNNNNNNDLYWRNKLGQTYRPIKLETIGSNLPLLNNISRQNFVVHPSNKLFPYGQLSFIFNNSMNPKTNAPKMIIENKCSELLDSEENQIVFSLLGRKCITLSTAVVQLLITYPPDHIKWNIKCTGVACFVKDNPKRSYFIRIFDFENKSCVWEQELYNTFYYREVRSYFHTFEADNCMAGLNFSSDSEAHHFYETIIGKLSNRSTKRNERRANQNPANIQPTGQGVTSIAAHKVHESKGSNFKKKKDKNKKKILTKEDIGIPTNFQHVQHIGWNPQTNNFNVENVDAKLMPFLESAGVTQDQLNDEQTVKFIYNFLSKNGGFDKAIEEIGNRPPPPSVPPVAPSMLTKKSANSAPPPPPPPSVQTHAGRKQTMAPSVPIPPPPPPVPAFPAPGVTSNSVPPPPPPPPPPPSFNPPNSAATVNGNNNQTPKLNPVVDSRSALMDQIRKGPNLNHVDPNEKLSHASPVERDDPRNQLLNQIRKGVDLKKIEPIKVEDKPTAESGGLAGALARALQERSRALNQTDDSDEENSDSTDEEWED